MALDAGAQLEKACNIEPAGPKIELAVYMPPEFICYEDHDGWLDPEVKQRAGDLAYAMNLPEIGHTKLGDLLWRHESIDPYRNLSAERIKKFAEGDGFFVHDSDPNPDNTQHVLAFRFGKARTEGAPDSLLIARRNIDGSWSYRQGTEHNCTFVKPFSNKDDNGEVIYDIETAPLKDFPEFAGYASMPYAGIVYAKMEDFPQFERDETWMPEL